MIPMPIENDSVMWDQTQQLVQFIRNEMPLAKAMDLQLDAVAHDRLGLRAPLAPNINDKGSAFGGSLATLMIVNGWALVEMALRLKKMDCDVFIAESQVRYLDPVWQDLRSQAKVILATDWARFFVTLQARGRARIGVECVVSGEDGKPAATLSARFVAKRRVPIVTV
jgi:thioesterase domain-containing protein